MEKVINLNKDRVFQNAVMYNDNHDYTREDTRPSVFLNEKVGEVREIISDLVVDGKLDALDLKIIRARDCSPLPSMRDLSMLLKVPRATICDRVGRIKELISKEL